jgi:arylsulfatase A-like enzyme
MRWTDTVLRDYVLPELRADVVIDWLGPLDSAQHAHGVGSAEAKVALREIDRSVSMTLQRMEALGRLAHASVFVTSDHGFAHHAASVDVVGRLVAAGLKASRSSTDLIVASQSQAVSLYLPGAVPARIEAVVRFLQQEPWADVVFTAGGADGQGRIGGTFSLDLIGGSHPTQAPDIVVSLPWQSAPNAFGAPGSHTIAAAKTGALTGQASGHGGLSPWVVRNTFVAWGAGVPRGRRTELPVSLADLAPTALAMLGLPVSAGPGRGRVLNELVDPQPASLDAAPVRRQFVTRHGDYVATLEISSIGPARYVEAGARQR